MLINKKQLEELDKLFPHRCLARCLHLFYTSKIEDKTVHYALTALFGMIQELYIKGTEGKELIKMSPEELMQKYDTEWVQWCEKNLPEGYAPLKDK